MKNEEKRFYETEYSYLALVNNSLCVMHKSGLRKAFTAIEICRGFSMELGRPLEQLETVLLESRIPIMFERLTQIRDVVIYRILRMQTGKVEDCYLGDIVVGREDGIIRCILQNTDYQKKNFLQYEKIGGLWALEIICSDDFEETKERVQSALVDVIGGSIGKDFEITTFCEKSFTGDGIWCRELDVQVQGEEIDLTYIFILDVDKRVEKTDCESSLYARYKYKFMEVKLDTLEL